MTTLSDSSRKRADNLLRTRAEAERDAIAREIAAADARTAEITTLRDEMPRAQAAIAQSDAEVERAVADCAPAEEALRKQYAQVAELRARAEEKRRAVLTLRAELQAHQRALDAYEFDRHGCLLPHDLDRALSRIHRDDDSPNLLLTDAGKIGIGGDARAITALCLHESHLPAGDLREYRQRLADVLR